MEYQAVRRVPAVLFPLLVFGGVFAYYCFDGGKKKEALGRLARRIRGQVGGFFYQSLRGMYEGIRFSLTLIPSGKNSPLYLTIEFFKVLPFTLQVGTENVFTFFAMK